MECPKCKAHNDDQAVCCSLCFETFKAKPKAPSAAGARPLVAFAAVSSLVEGFVIAGPMVIGDNGIHFFIKTLRRADERRAGTQIGGQLGGVGGFLIGAAINAAVDKATDAESLRPGKLIYRGVGEVLAACEGVLSDAPDLASCKELHTVEKKDVESISFGFLGGMTLKTRWLTLEVSGIEPVDKASASLKVRGYPLA